jgi:hypothetical protein
MASLYSSSLRHSCSEARGSLSMSLVDSFNSSSSCFGEELLLDVRD